MAAEERGSAETMLNHTHRRSVNCYAASLLCEHVSDTGS